MSFFGSLFRKPWDAYSARAAVRAKRLRAKAEQQVAEKAINEQYLKDHAKNVHGAMKDAGFAMVGWSSTSTTLHISYALLAGTVYCVKVGTRGGYTLERV